MGTLNDISQKTFLFHHLERVFDLDVFSSSSKCLSFLGWKLSSLHYDRVIPLVASTSSVRYSVKTRVPTKSD